MHRKKIKERLEKEVLAWLESIEDAAVRDRIRSKIIVTGGAIASLLETGEYKDLDIYLADKEAALAVAEYYVSRFKCEGHKAEVQYDEETDRISIYIKSVGILEDGGYEDSEDESVDVDNSLPCAKHDPIEKKEDKKPYRAIFLSQNAITLTNKVQIIVRFFGTPKEIHSNFDYVHCRNYYTTKENKVVLNAAALESLVCKRLIYGGSKYPICSIFRMRKFIERGWTISAGQVLKMSWQISELDLTDFEVLKDQLIGVDSAYFSDLVNIMAHDKAHGRTIDETYLAGVIDRVFEGRD